MVGRLLLVFGVCGLAAGVARLATRSGRRPRSGPVAEAAALTAVTRDAAGVWVLFESGLPEPGSDRAARCWLTEDGGERYGPVSVLRQLGSLPVLETHWFAVPSEVGGLRLHVTAGLGLPVLTVPVPAAPALAETPLRLIA